jgi:hypothetical protein
MGQRAAKALPTAAAILILLLFSQSNAVFGGGAATSQKNSTNPPHGSAPAKGANIPPAPAVVHQQTIGQFSNGRVIVTMPGGYFSGLPNAWNTTYIFDSQGPVQITRQNDSITLPNIDIIFNGDKTMPLGNARVSVVNSTTISETYHMNNPAVGITVYWRFSYTPVNTTYFSSTAEITIAGNCGGCQLYWSVSNNNGSSLHHVSQDADQMYIGGIGIDWAKSLAFNPTWDNSSLSLTYTVPNGQFVIDPSIVGTQANPYLPMGMHEAWYANGLYWAFYNDGYNLVYRTSSSGTGGWSASTTWRSGAFNNKEWDTYVNGTAFAYCTESTATDTYNYRSGTLNSNGTVTWSASESSFITYGEAGPGCLVARDASGNVWVVSEDTLSKNGIPVGNPTMTTFMGLGVLSGGSVIVVGSTGGSGHDFDYYFIYNGTDSGSLCLYGSCSTSASQPGWDLCGSLATIGDTAYITGCDAYYQIFYYTLTYNGPHSSSWATRGAAGIVSTSNDLFGTMEPVATDGSSKFVITYAYSNYRIDYLGEGSWPPTSPDNILSSLTLWIAGPDCSDLIQSNTLPCMWVDDVSGTLNVVYALESFPVTQPITATLNAVYGGSTQNITISSCDPSPSTVPGDGSAYNVALTKSCSFSLSLPIGYQWTTSSSGTSCSSGTCSSFSATYERTLVTQPVTATFSGSGSAQTIYVLTCGGTPTTFAGDGSSYDITAASLCPLTLGLSSGYVWESTGTFEITDTTCGSGTCPGVSPSYMKSVEATLYPPNLVNLTGSSSSVYVNLFNATNNVFSGASCSGPPCTPNTGGISFQFNVVLPNFRVANNTSPYHYCGTSANKTSGCLPFMVQSTIEFYNNGTCKAVPQGAPSAALAPKNPVIYTFACSTITAPATSFKWIVDSSGGFFTDIRLQTNGTTQGTWTPSQIFDMMYWPGSGSINMTNSYAQSVFAGNFSSWKYGNVYSGGGFVSYSGADLLHRINGTLGTLKVTTEESNVEYTAIPASVTVTSSNQTYDAGVFDSYYVGSNGSVLSGQYIIGPPDGNYAQLEALSSGTTACAVGEFEIGGPLVNGTIAIYGYAARSSAVQVSVSAGLGTCTGGSWTQVYRGTWSSSTPLWIPIGSWASIESIKITTSYSGSAAGGADVYVDSISAFMGSYAQSFKAPYESSLGVTNASNILGIFNSTFAILQTSSGTPAWINASLGTEYSGELVIYGHSAPGYNSSFSVDYSSNGSSWTNQCAGNWTSTSEGPLVCGAFGVTKALYIKITVYDTGNPADLYIDGLYVA